jgi:hypothetical protein
MAVGRPREYDPAAPGLAECRDATVHRLAERFEQAVAEGELPFKPAAEPTAPTCTPSLIWRWPGGRSPAPEGTPDADGSTARVTDAC